jgi:TonB family protein
MRKLLLSFLIVCSCVASAQSADTEKLPQGGHLESAGGGNQWLVTADGRRLPWNVTAAADLTYNAKHHPRFPAEAIRQHHSGSVVTLALIGTNGEVKGVTIERSSGFPELDEAAVDTVKGWKFAPAYKSGVPTESYARMPLSFDLPVLRPTPHT